MDWMCRQLRADAVQQPHGERKPVIKLSPVPPRNGPTPPTRVTEVSAVTKNCMPTASSGRVRQAAECKL